MVKQFLFLLLILPVFQIAAKWVQTNGPGGGNITSIVKTGSVLYVSTGSASIMYGSGIYRSTDDGLSWSELDYLTNIRDDKNATSVAAAGNFIAFGSNKGIVYISRDNGLSWERMKITLTSKDIVSLVISGTNLFAATNGDGVFSTPMAATAWSAVNTNLTSKNITSMRLEGTTIYVTTFGGGKVFTATDPAAGWTAISMPASVFNTFATASGSGKLFVSAQNGIYGSTDNGSTWAGPYSGVSFSVNALAVSGTTLFAGNGDGVYTMPVTGNTLTKLNSAAFGATSFLVSSSGIFAGGLRTLTNQKSGLWFSSNNGSSWAERNTGLAGTVIQALQHLGNTMFAVVNPYGVYSSTDNGNTWVLSDARAYSYDATVQLIAVKNNKIYITANNGMLVSADTGRSWTLQTATFTPQALFFYGNRLFAGETNGIRVSTDNGITWSQANTGLSGFLSTNCFEARGGKLYAGLYSSGVYVSTDSGTTWTASSTGLTSQRIRQFAFVGNQIFAATDGGGINRSTDGGQTWSAANVQLSSSNCWSLATDGSRLFAGCNDGVFASYDTAATWGKTSPWPMITNVVAIANGNLYAGTFFAGVWRRQLTQFIVGVPEKVASPLSFSLEQNYPNPFNPSTSITFTLPEGGFVSVAVYNAAGAEVAVVFKGYAGAGTHKVDFTAPAWLPSGVYFYRVEYNGTVQVKRMALIK